MTITAEIILDSSHIATGKRITTMLLRYPRFIHSEFMTHRMFSRNASSSRAIPFEKLVDDIRRDTAMPVSWGKNRRGMQATEELSLHEIADARRRWLIARDNAIHQATYMNLMGLHKQVVNRILEPFAHINVLVTATEWENFFHQRLHPDAQPEMQELARVMKIAMTHATTFLIEPGEWHLPFINHVDYEAIEDDRLLCQVSAARCARLSYMTFDGKRSTVEEDVKLFAKLVGSDPVHASPLEHQAQAMDKIDHNDEGRDYFESNFRDFRQFRKLLGH